MVGVLCAPTLNNRRFVHFGSRTDGELDAANPLREDHFQVKNLIEDAWTRRRPAAGLLPKLNHCRAEPET